MLNLAKNHRSSFEKLNPNSNPNSAVDMVEERSGWAGGDCDVGRESKDNTSMEASRTRVNSSKIEASKEAEVEGEKRRRKRKEGEQGSTDRASLLPWCLGRKAGQRRGIGRDDTGEVVAWRSCFGSDCKSICSEAVKQTKSPKSDEFHQNRVFNKLVSVTVNLVRVQIVRLVC
jgi:hypothetical protein